jgi:ribosomal protein L7/L12
MGLVRHVHILSRRHDALVLLEPYPTGCVVRFRRSIESRQWHWSDHWFATLAQAKVYLAEHEGVRPRAWIDVLDANAFDRKVLHRSRYDVAVYGAQAHMRKGLFINAVKLYRNATKTPLKEAKMSCDHIRDVLRANQLYPLKP